MKIYLVTYRLVLALFATLFFSVKGWSQVPEIGTYELLSVGPLPVLVMEGQEFELVFSGFNLPLYDKGATLVEVENNTIRVSSLSYSCWSAGNPPLPPNDAPTIRNIPVEGLPAGTYRVEADWGSSCAGQHATLEGEIAIYSDLPAPVLNAESPFEGQTLSGVGVIRGWVCDASSVEVQFDNLPLLAIAYGTSRADTIDLCEDDNNGYGAVFAWGLLGHGPHRARTFIDGVVVSDITFQVSGLDEPFVKGLEGVYELPDFSGPGESVTVQWSEADQNFIIVGHSIPEPQNVVDPTTSWERQMWLLATDEAINCGALYGRDAITVGLNVCVRESFQANTPFYGSYTRGGTDSLLADGIAYDGMSLYLIGFDSYNAFEDDHGYGIVECTGPRYEPEFEPVLDSTWIPPFRCDERLAVEPVRE